MLMVDLMIILFHLKLDKFYCIGAMNQLEMICYDFFICSYKIEFLAKKAKDRYHNCFGEDEADEYYIAIKKV